ncbi:potassium-transporting ATPase subunit F [Alcanivorax sp. 24]|uniref:potassium-transporting ATPase subunit F n=1 Tax=Alcanivorax sp. 24 TaxID=2545266 RepID=UPI00105C3D29
MQCEFISPRPIDKPPPRRFLRLFYAPLIFSESIFYAPRSYASPHLPSAIARIRSMLLLIVLGIAAYLLATLLWPEKF